MTEFGFKSGVDGWSIEVVWSRDANGDRDYVRDADTVFFDELECGLKCKGKIAIARIHLYANSWIDDMVRIAEKHRKLPVVGWMSMKERLEKTDIENIWIRGKAILSQHGRHHAIPGAVARMEWFGHSPYVHSHSTRFRGGNTKSHT